jgi:hypothetical protein
VVKATNPVSGIIDSAIKVELLLQDKNWSLAALWQKTDVMKSTLVRSERGRKNWADDGSALAFAQWVSVATCRMLMN